MAMSTGTLNQISIGINNSGPPVPLNEEPIPATKPMANKGVFFSVLAVDCCSTALRINELAPEASIKTAIKTSSMSARKNGSRKAPI